jgi:hypothetical protein
VTCFPGESPRSTRSCCHRFPLQASRNRSLLNWGFVDDSASAKQLQIVSNLTASSHCGSFLPSYVLIENEGNRLIVLRSVQSEPDSFESYAHAHQWQLLCTVDLWLTTRFTGIPTSIRFYVVGFFSAGETECHPTVGVALIIAAGSQVCFHFHAEPIRLQPVRVIR